MFETVALVLAQTRPWLSNAMLPGPPNDLPSPQNFRARYQPAGAVVRAGVKSGCAGTWRMTSTGWPDGFVGSSVIACHVVEGRWPHASEAAVRKAAQSLVRATQPAMMLASELNEESVSVEVPFGSVRKNFVSFPSLGSTMLRGIRAAFGSPGADPPMDPFSANWASENPAATVVRSLTTMPPERMSPSDAASSTSGPRTCTPDRPPAAVAYRTASARTVRGTVTVNPPLRSVVTVSTTAAVPGD